MADDHHAVVVIVVVVAKGWLPVEREREMTVVWVRTTRYRLPLCRDWLVVVVGHVYNKRRGNENENGALPQMCTIEFSQCRANTAN